MKKIAIMLLAALMLFAFVACDNTTEEPKTSEVAAAMTEDFTDTAVAGQTVKVSEIQKDLTIAEDGKVSGTLLYYTIDEACGYQADDHHFAAIELTVTLEEGEKIFTEGGKYENTTGSEDKTWLICVDSEAENQKITFKVGTDAESAEKLITLDFTGVTLAPEN